MDVSTPDAQPSTMGAGCYYMAVPPPPPTALDAGSCKSSILAQGYVAEGGSTTIAPVYDDAGNVIDDGGTVSGSGGISGVPVANVVGANGTTTMTISGKSVGAYTISGLTNGPPGYTIAVSAVDGVGNVGPPSGEMCDFPAPVNDFYKTYRLAGGRAGGGFCTLEAVGAPVDLTILALPAAATAIGLARRRRRRKP